MIQVHVDLTIDPSREQEMLRFFAGEFRPAAAKFEGFVDVNMLRLRAVIMGAAPSGVNYRFVIRYTSEDLRQKWIASDIHQKVWGNMEKVLLSPGYGVLLFEVY